MSLNNKKIAPLTLIYLIKDGRVLLLKRNTNKAMFPGQVLGIGGKLEPHEDLIASAQREFLEETDLVIDNPRLRGTYAWYDDDDDYGGTLYIFTATKFTGKLKDSDEGKLFWHNINQLDDLEDQPEHQKLFIKKILLDENFFFSGLAHYHNGKIVELSDSNVYFQEREKSHDPNAQN